jgi:hypothetical protein
VIPITGPARSPSPPLFAGQTLAWRLLFPVRPHVDVSAARAALGAYDLVTKPRHFGIVRVFRHVDQALVAARIVEAGRNEPLYAEMAHVAERHRGAGWVLGCHAN